MRRVTYYLLWLFVFSLAWGDLALPWIGRVTYLLGIAVIGAGMLTTAMHGQFRKPGSILCLALAFVVSAVLSVIWSISAEVTLDRVWTYTQLVAIVWIVWEFARKPEEQQWLLVAFCLGMFVPEAILLHSFNTGILLGYQRFTASGYNADELGLTCALTIPIAWRLMLNCRGAVRVIALICFVLAPVGIMLTATRGAFLAGVVALSIIPLTLPRLSRRSAVLVTSVLIVAAAAAAETVPQVSWTRIFTIRQEMSAEGNVGGRVLIWAAGWRVFQDRPILGVGAGAFGEAVYPLLYERAGAHNTPLAVLVEQGIVGLLIFAALLGACARIIGKMAPPERIFWGVLMLSWLVGVMSVHWQYNKFTWLLFGLLAAQGALRTDRRTDTEQLVGLERRPRPSGIRATLNSGRRLRWSGWTATTR
jgi:O-antigen ligase